MYKSLHAFCNDVLADYDAVELARMVREREVSAIELTRAAIARAERVQPSLAAIAHSGFEQACAAAERPLTGAFGNDGGGSLRIPAACCGLFGLKPTRGRLPMNEAARQLPLNIVCEGVMTRSVRDTAHFYAEAERHFINRKLPRIGLVEGPSNARLRIGMVLDSVEADPTDGPTRSAVLDVAKHLESLGHTVSEIQLPEETRTLPSDFSLYWAMIAFLSTTFGRLSIRRDFDAARVDGLTRGLAGFYKSHAMQTPGAMLRLARSARLYARVMIDYDMILSPVVAHTTSKLGHLSADLDFETLFSRLRNYACFTPLNNATGSPAMSLPLGATSDGLPIGVHFSGRRGEERTLLELAYELEQPRPFRRIQAAAPASA